MTKNLFVILLFSVFAIPLSYGERYSDSGNLQFNELDPYVINNLGFYEASNPAGGYYMLRKQDEK